MICPECGAKMYTDATVYNTDEGEIYRRKICTDADCGYVAYTVEYEVEVTERFEIDWNRYHKYPVRKERI